MKILLSDRQFPSSFPFFFQSAVNRKLSHFGDAAIKILIFLQVPQNSIGTKFFIKCNSTS